MRALAVFLILTAFIIPAEAAKEPGCKVTLAHFQKINVRGSIGALYEAAGCRGTTISDTAVGGQRSRMEQWEGTEPYSNMIVTITNGWITNKAQFGLK